jgi:hypothetical protein
MLTQDQISLLNVIKQRLAGVETNRHRYQAWREALHLYEDVVRQDFHDDRAPATVEFASLRRLARQAFSALGGSAEPVPISLHSYDHERYGPFLGVSDEGGVAGRIRNAFRMSPKALALGRHDPLAAGGAVDAERLVGAGEAPVGPKEYCDIQSACIGRALTTTNVGTRVNARYYNDPPSVAIYRRDKSISVLASVKKLFSPYMHTPDGQPEPVTLFANFAEPIERSKQLGMLRYLKKKMQAGGFCDPSRHRLGMLVRTSSGVKSCDAVQEAISICAEAGIHDLAVEGSMRREAVEQILMPGLLNYFDKAATNRLMASASEKQILLRPWKQMDVDTVARTTWASLQTARNMGLYLGKYGLIPLSLQETDYVIGELQSWFSDWSAAPAFYIDYPAVTLNRVYDEEDAAEAMTCWLKVAKKHGVRIALIDTADKAKGRALLKQGPSDTAGILSIEQVRDLDAFARGLGIKTLWAGGISVAQAYDFGLLGVFGIYTTTSTARMVAVTGDYRHDPSMPDEKEPTYRGVYRVKLLLEAGFVQERLSSIGQSGAAKTICDHAQSLIEQLGDATMKRDGRVEKQLTKALLEGWRRLLGDSQ